MTISTLIDSLATSAGSRRSLELAVAAARTAEENNGRDVIVLDMRGLKQLFDFFLVATGSSRRQMHAMSEEIDHRLEDDLNDKRMGIEGYAASRWILLDYGTVVVHLFENETREYFSLESLWGESERVDWEQAESELRAAADG